MLSLRMGSGAEMVLCYMIPKRFSLLPSRRVSRYFSALPSHCGPKLPRRHANAQPVRRTHNNAGPSSSTGWAGWRYWVAIWKPLPLGVGLALLAILQWRRIVRRTGDGQVTTEVAKDWEITCYRTVPLRAMSRAWGWLTQRELPPSVRPWLYSQYAAAFGCNLDEAASSDLASYKSLADFFCRELKDGVRPLQPCTIVSPADGRILSLGRVTHCKVEQVKGVTYSLRTFLGEPSWLEAEGELSDYFKPQDSIKPPGVPAPCSQENYEQCLLENPDSCLYQCVVYLAPGDYHRFHSPVQWDVAFRRHFQGELLSVNPRVAKWIPGLFTLNERAVYVGKWKHGFFSLTAVGATNVGSIRVYCDKALVTNQRKWRHQAHRHRDLFLAPAPVPVSKGAAFGEFRLGSTIVLLFEAPRDFQFAIQPGQKIRVGESIGQNAD